LKVTRQRKDFAIKTALGAVKSNDFVAYEETFRLKIWVKNHKLLSQLVMQLGQQFSQWLDIPRNCMATVIAGSTSVHLSQECSTCGNLVKKMLSTRTHICGCGTRLDRDHNAALNILAKGLKQAGINLNTVGHTEINAWGQTDLYSLMAAKQR
jgi:putative transposase